MRLASEAGWYRIPVSSAHKWLKDRWPPRWLAFYQTKVFSPEAHAVNYYAPVHDIRIVSRMDLFPDTPCDHPKVIRRYYQLLLEDLQPLDQPIVSRRWRRIVFIPTTLDKFKSAIEINDLWDESPLEDRTYFLDFAIFCNQGKIDVETDGDTWHIGPESAQVDRLRDNNLASFGWKVLRFNTTEIHERPVNYCARKVMVTINRLDGLDHTTGVPDRYDPDDPLGPRQLGLFDREI
jgi:hypothetical protein